MKPLTFAILLALIPVGVLADDEGTQLQAIVAKNSPAIVTVKAVLKMEMKGAGGAGQESRLAVPGVVIDPSGMVVISNMPFSPKRMMEMMGAPESALAEMGLKMTPSSLKVVIEREDKEYDAFVAATDTVYDVAFVKIEGLGDRKLASIDFSNAVSPALGQKVVAVSRLGKGYDFAPFFQSARVSGEIGKPRKAWMLDGGISGFGLPVFTEAGDVVGILSTVPSGVREEGSSDQMGFSMMMRMLMGGGGSAPGGAFVLPGAPLKALLEQAKAQAVTVAAERAKKKDTKPAPAPTTAPKKPGKPQN